MGGLVGRNEGSVVNCSVVGEVSSTGGGTGGLVGENHYGHIIDSQSSVVVTGNDRVGGLAGSNSGTINNSSAEGTVSGVMSVGGLVGVNSATIRNSYARGSVDGSVDWDHRAFGGLVGSNRGIVANSYSTGAVSGRVHVGGFIGYNGYLSGVTVESSFWDSEASQVSNSAGGTGLGTRPMHEIITFLNAGWDFAHETINGVEDIWTIHDEGYPCHVWECGVSGNVRAAGDFGGMYGVDFVDFAFFIEHWMSTGCDNTNQCRGTDLIQDGRVDLADFGILGRNWGL